MAIAGVVISSLTIIAAIVIATLVGRVALEVGPGLQDFATELEQIQQNDPELAALLEDQAFSSQVEQLTEQKVLEVIGEYQQSGFVLEVGEVSEVMDVALQAYKDALYELRDEYIAQNQQAQVQSGN